MDIDILLTPGEDGERTIFDKTIRAQHLHEVQLLLGRLEDMLTIGAAPGVLIRASKFLHICQTFNAEISKKDVLAVLNLTPQPHKNVNKAGLNGPAAESKKTPTTPATPVAPASEELTVAEGSAVEADNRSTPTGSATSPSHMTSAIPHQQHGDEGKKGEEKEEPDTWHGLTLRNFDKRASRCLVDINDLGNVMKAKGLVRGLLNHYTHEPAERADTHITSVAERRASAIHRWKLARVNLAGLVRFRVESNLAEQQAAAAIGGYAEATDEAALM